MSLRTPLGTVLGRGAARGGVHHWWLQRLTAMALIPLTLWLLWSLTRLSLADYDAVSHWVATAWNPVLLVLTVLVMSWHSMLGVQEVVEDYVHGQFSKALTLLLMKFAHVLIAAAGVYAVLRVALRSL